MRDNIFTFTTGSECDRRECFVFLPGWGFPGRIIELAAPRRSWLAPDGQLDPATALDELADFLDHHRIDSLVLAGWSLGANLAVDFALRYPERIKALYLLAMRQSWPSGEIEGIRTDLDDDPIGFMKTFYRKCFLGHQPDYREFAATLEESCLAALDRVKLEAGLAYLENFKFGAKSARLSGLNIPTYVLHGAKDIIAPPTEMAALPGAICRLIKNAGHPVFLDRACPLDWHRKKETIRLKFSRSAATYDNHAALQKEVAGRLVELLPATTPETILETGCGTGAYTALLNKRYPAARITAIDFAENMLARAREKLAVEPNVAFRCTDAEIFLRESGEQFDLITSNATMHWFDNLENSARLIHERLTGRGALLCSIFGPRTMRELRDGLNEIHDREVPAASSFFPDEEELRRIFAGLFPEVEIGELQLVRHYPNLSGLLKNISRTGTAGWHPGHHLLSRGQLKDLEQWFIEQHGHCRVSYQVFMVRCFKRGG